jgi:MFS family permease
MLNYLKVLRQFHRDVWLNLAMWALLAFAYFGVMAVLFNLYLLRLGYAPPFIGLLVGVGQLTWALCALPAGVIGIRLGTRTTMILGLVTVTGGWILLLLAEALPAPLPLAGLFAGWMLSWAGGAFFVVNATPFLMSITTLTTCNHAFALQGSATSFFALLGSLVGGVVPTRLAVPLGATLDQPGPYQAALWIMPLACGLATLVLLLTRRALPADSRAAAPAAAQPAPGSAGRGLLLFIGLLLLCQAMGEGVVRAFFNVYLDVGLHVPTAQIGTIFSVAQMLPIVAALVTPLVIARLGKTVTMSLAMAGIAAGLLLLALNTGVILTSVGYLAVLALAAILGPTLTLFNQEAAPAAWRTTVAAVSTLGFALGSSLAALAGGYVVANLGFAALFLGGMTAVLLALLLLRGYLHLVASLGSMIPAATSLTIHPVQLTPEGSS